MGTLYLVATPIGNLEDLSPRAQRILRQASLIAAEDTRKTRVLLNHFNIHTPITSYFEHNKLVKMQAILSALDGGDIALVSDAGTPALNDPGYELVKAALQSGHTVSPIPGPSAPLAALVASGLPTDSFVYLGYLPRKPGERLRRLQAAASMPHTLIFLESPRRLLDSLADLQSALGDRQAAVARELTKMHEEIFRGRLSAAREHFQANAPRGEITLVIAGKANETPAWSDEQVRAALIQELNSGEPASRLARRIADQAGWPKSRIYDLLKEMVEKKHGSG